MILITYSTDSESSESLAKKGYSHEQLVIRKKVTKTAVITATNRETASMRLITISRLSSIASFEG